MERNDAYKAIYLDGDISIDDLDASLAQREQAEGAYGFLSPASTYHRFMTGLTGGKMSSSKPNSAIFLTDTPEVAKKKIQEAKTGGAVSLEEQRRHGGNPEECVIYELFLYHLIREDKELEEIYRSCVQGEQMCGKCKKMAIQLMEHFLVELHKKRKDSLDTIQDYVNI
jgi:tryptophanyl-tRNA synthetase